MSEQMYTNCSSRLSEPAEKSEQDFGPRLVADPEQTFAVVVNLMDQRQVLVVALSGDLVNPDGLDAARALMGASPQDGRLHRTKQATQETRNTSATTFQDNLFA